MIKAWIALACLAGCAADTSDDGASGQFWNDFEASRYSRADDDIGALDAELAAAPDDGHLAVLASVARLWRFAELGRDPALDPSQIPAQLADMLASFERAQALAPDEPHLDCWLGGVRIIAGNATGDPDLVAAGQRDLQRGVERFPQFTLACVALNLVDLPASDPAYAGAAEALFGLYDSCLGDTIDRADPDYAPYLDRETHDGPRAACWNDTTHPHGLEGSFVLLGDVLVKQGETDAARVAYHNATLIEGYSSWPYRGLIEERAAADLEARAALYRDADPENDPPMLGSRRFSHNCSTCHATEAGEP